jgi:phage gp29-like protein
VNPFSAAMVATSFRSTAVPAVALPAKAGTTNLAAAGMNDLLRQIVRPQAAANWLAPQVAAMTPQRIESILRGALTGDYTQAWQLFDLMEDTWPRLMKNLNEVRRSVTKMEFKVEAWAEEGEAPSESALEKAKFVSRCVRKMRPDVKAEENGFHQTIYDLLDAWGKGVSVCEVLWDNGDDGWVPRATTWVSPMNYGWANDGTMGLTLAPTRTGQSGFGLAELFSGLRRGQDVMPFIEGKFLVGIAKAKTAHSSCAALLRPLAWWWCAMNFSSDWLLNFAQIFGLPIRIGKYDPTQPGLFEKVCDFLERMGSNPWAAMPVGTEIEIHEASKGGGAGNATPQGDLIDRADKQCDLLVLGQTLTTDVSRAGTGSKALGEVHADVRDDIIQSAGDFAADILNQQLVTALMQLNYGSQEEAPEFRAAPKKVEDKKANADRFLVLTQAGLKIPEAYVYENQEIPMPQGGEPTIGGTLPVGPQVDGTTTDSTDGADGNDSTGGNGGNGAEVKASQSGPRGATVPTSHGHAHDETIDRLLESVSGVEARWLGGLKPHYRELVLMARNASSDEEFGRQLQAVVDRSARSFPELFGKMDVEFLADRLEGVMGAACVNGAVNGYLKRNSQQKVAKAAKGGR